MDVILLERVEKLGAIGDVVKVKDGFARNFLLPRKKALRANEANRKVFEANRERLEAENAAKRTDAEKEAKGLDGTSLTLIRQSSNTGQLYGSVAVRDIVEALEADGHKIAKAQVVLDKPIKAIGVHEIKVALHPEVSVAIKINVARSPEEAEMQASGVDVMAQMFEEGRDAGGFTEDYQATEDAAAVLGEEVPAEDRAEDAVEAAEASNDADQA
ncbi:MAG TPA: 50S ribosomal protein L9 [Sphingomonas sp.]|nr:50S ribosomal protein L9 [Sphingomonas sp.]